MCPGCATTPAPATTSNTRPDTDRPTTPPTNGSPGTNPCPNITTAGANFSATPAYGYPHCGSNFSASPGFSPATTTRRRIQLLPDQQPDTGADNIPGKYFADIANNQPDIRFQHGYIKFWFQ
jgi:hypothetical protein